jgi:tRNA threonylcarbamoyl adenosine modification protein YeaZ
MSVVLAIETSQHIGGVAVRDHSGRVEVEMLSPKKRHDDDLMPAIDRLFRRTDLQPRDLEAVGVSIGPGGFTGLRIAVSTAKMLAETLGANVIGVPTALVAAESTMKDSRAATVIVALASKGETCWCTRLNRHEATWRIASDPGLSDAASLNLTGVDALLGDQYLPPSFRDRCANEGVPVIDPPFDPATCLLIAERLLASGTVTDPLHLLPLYPRQPEAVTIWEARAKDS